MKRNTQIARSVSAPPAPWSSISIPGYHKTIRDDFPKWSIASKVSSTFPPPLLSRNRPRHPHFPLSHSHTNPTQNWPTLVLLVLLSRADKKSTSTSSFSFFTSSSSKFEEAHDLYQSAGNAYKIDKRFKDAGDCFVRAAEMALKMEEKDDAANDFWTASKAYKLSNPERE